MHIFINSDAVAGKTVVPYEAEGSAFLDGALVLGFYTGETSKRENEYFVATLDFRYWPDDDFGTGEKYGNVIIWQTTSISTAEGVRYEVCNDLGVSPTIGDLIPWHVTRTSHGA